MLDDLRSLVKQNTGTKDVHYKLTHFEPLDNIQALHLSATKSPALAISGRHLPLLYHFIANILSPPHSFALLLIDIDGRFDPTRLTCPASCLKYLYVQRPARSALNGSHDTLKQLVSEGEDFMIYGDGGRQSEGREWWGTVVIGGGGGGGGVGDVKAGWKGWARVEREGVSGWSLGMSAEEAWASRESRQGLVDKTGWAVESAWGGFVFHEGAQGG